MSLNELGFIIPEESRGVVIENVAELRRIEENLRKIFNNNNIVEVLIPSFEYVELYKNLYENFEEDKTFNYIGKDGKVISLRWDFTIPIARYYSSQNTDKEAKYSYFGKVYRKEKKYTGKASETYQAGIEFVNNVGIEGNVECLNILQESLPIIGLNNLKLELGSAKLFNRICELVEDREQLIDILSKKNISQMEEFIASKNFDEKLSKFLLKLPRLCGNIDMLNDVIELVQDETVLKALKELKTIYEELKFKDNIIFDLGMCPTMEYYTCLMFKVYSPNSPDPIISGGRYDSIYKKFGKDVPAIGMGYYLNNMLKAIESQGENND